MNDTTQGENLPAEHGTGSQSPTWVPAFPGQRPPFQQGHTLSLKHGAWSDRLVKPRAREIAQGLADDDAIPGYLLEARYRPALMAYTTTLARIERLESWLERTAAEDVPLELSEGGSVRGATKLLERLEASAGRQRQELGLTPLAAARLGKDVAQGQQASLTTLWAQMDREAQETPAQRARGSHNAREDRTDGE